MKNKMDSIYESVWDHNGDLSVKELVINMIVETLEDNDVEIVDYNKFRTALGGAYSKKQLEKHRK